jgi:hypothetical protein
VSCETSFDSKQPQLEPKLVSVLSETRRLFLVVLVEPKKNQNEPKKLRNEQKWIKIVLAKNNEGG